MDNIILRLAVIEKTETDAERAVRTTALKFIPQVIILELASSLHFRFLFFLDSVTRCRVSNATEAGLRWPGGRARAGD